MGIYKRKILRKKTRSWPRKKEGKHDLGQEKKERYQDLDQKEMQVLRSFDGLNGLFDGLNVVFS